MSEEQREDLLKRRDELKHRLDAIMADAARGLDKDSGERAVELENAEVLKEIARVTMDELKEVEEKLNPHYSP